MLALVSAGGAETANGAVERMVLLGLTSRIISNFVARFRLAAKNAKIAKCRGDYGADEIKLPQKVPRWLRPFNIMLIQLIIYGRVLSNRDLVDYSTVQPD